MWLIWDRAIKLMLNCHTTWPNLANPQSRKNQRPTVDTPTPTFSQGLSKSSNSPSTIPKPQVVSDWTFTVYILYVGIRSKYLVIVKAMIQITCRIESIVVHNYKKLDKRFSFCYLKNTLSDLYSVRIMHNYWSWDHFVKNNERSFLFLSLNMGMVFRVFQTTSSVKIFYPNGLLYTNYFEINFTNHGPYRYSKFMVLF